MAFCAKSVRADRRLSGGNQKKSPHHLWRIRGGTHYQGGLSSSPLRVVDSPPHLPLSHICRSLF